MLRNPLALIRRQSTRVATITVGLLTLLAVPAGAAHVLIAQDRGVYAEVAASEDGEYDSEATPDEASNFSDFVSTAQASGSTTDAVAGATSTLDSTINGETIVATGSANGSAGTSAVDARGRAPSDGFFELIFEAATTEDYTLTTSVEADSVLGDGFASVQLVHLDTEAQLVSYEAGVGDSFGNVDVIGLVAGDQYRLTAYSIAVADIEAPALESGDASFGVMLMVPEPSLLMLQGAGALAITAIAGLRRRRSRCSFSNARAETVREMS
jgi:hypothetical protein